ncbi:MAG: hypothetical protein ACI9U2_003326, partial [Bradymonadia bacterium]
MFRLLSPWSVPGAGRAHSATRSIMRVLAAGALAAAAGLGGCSSDPAVRVDSRPPPASPGSGVIDLPTPVERPAEPPVEPGYPSTNAAPVSAPIVPVKAPTPRPAPPAIPVARTAVNERNLRSAPARYHRVSPRAFRKTSARCRELVYECNNLEIRGPNAGATYAADGVEIAARWRKYAAGVGGIFVLRDSLWSQQDHPTGHRAYAPMMPPNWVTVAVAAAASGRPLTLPSAPPIDDDAAWSALTLATMYGDLPVSGSLHRAASAADTTLSADDRRALAHNARHVHRLLTDDVRAMWSAAPSGAAAVAAAGAERIAASDRAYFGAELRRRA